MPGNLFNYLYPSNPTQTLPAQVASTFIHGGNVIYGLTYENNGNGSNKVKLLIKPLYPAKAYEYDMGFSILDEFKDQVSLALVKHSPETDKIAVILPEEATNKQGKKYIEGLLFNTYEINLSISGPVVKQLDTVALQKNINSKSLANEGNSYFQPKVTQVEVTKARGKVEHGIVVTANNLKEKTAVAWYLKQNKNGEFKALIGTEGIIERNLFKLSDSNSEFALNGNTLLHSQTSQQIVDNHKVETTNIFTFNIAEAVKEIKNGKGINKNEYLLNHDHNTALFSSKDKIRCLQYMAQNKKFAFLESNTLHICSLNNIGEKPTIYEFQGPIEQLYIEENDQGNIIATAVSEGNIIVVHIDHATQQPTYEIKPINTIQNLNDFLNIIHGQLPPNIASSTTVATTLTPATTTAAPTIATKQSTTPITVTTSKSTPDEITVITKQSTTPTQAATTAASTAVEEQPTTPITVTTSKSTPDEITVVTKQSTTPTQAATTAASTAVEEQPTTPITVTTSKSTPDEITVVTKQSTTPGATIKRTTAAAAATTKPTTAKKQSIPPTQAATTAAEEQPTTPIRYIIPTTVAVSERTANPTAAQELPTTSPYTMAGRTTQASLLGIAGKSNNNGGVTALSTVGAIGVAGLLTFGIWIYNKYRRSRNVSESTYELNNMECGSSNRASTHDPSDHSNSLKDVTSIATDHQSIGPSKCNSDEESTSLNKVSTRDSSDHSNSLENVSSISTDSNDGPLVEVSARDSSSSKEGSTISLLGRISTRNSSSSLSLEEDPLSIALMGCYGNSSILSNRSSTTSQSMTGVEVDNFSDKSRV